ncbi:NAD(P)/FAD-dependent oxidoreductase [Streptomyces coffeae]|uniref:NAD(P)/FAD-dependent oxidoreductase n=1 Tax=Streptomyces coffeae TaxID=621382 RepID=A0ABS1NM50_9ACTN|nr:NAD(P)/FAD-dependent oxidoreductase [Streptomyces coffeae]MBL1101068.1 NAD(P)/FAD-dependent oxidoreductase [Streptomyces coffeae]
MTPTAQYDTVIVGGGPAGLTAALALTRYRHRTLVVESPGPPRNAASRGVHGMIGLEGATPAQVRTRAWAELDTYGLAERREDTVENVTRADDGGFRTVLSDGTAVGSPTVLLATGVIDALPDGVEGFSECWGRTVIHCPFCVGWENADRTWGLIADDPDYAAMAAYAFSAWSADVIAIAPPGMDRRAEIRAQLRGAGSDLVEGEITRLHHRDGDLYAVEFADGTHLDRQTLLWSPPQKQVPLVTRLTQNLGLALDDGFVTVGPDQQTRVPGLYAAGDLTTAWEQGAMNAAGAGAAAADAIHFARRT